MKFAILQIPDVIEKKRMPDSDSATQNYMKTGGFVSGQFWLLSCVIGRSARKKVCFLNMEIRK